MDHNIVPQYDVVARVHCHMFAGRVSDGCVRRRQAVLKEERAFATSLDEVAGMLDFVVQEETLFHPCSQPGKACLKNTFSPCDGLFDELSGQRKPETFRLIFLLIHALLI